MQKSLVNILLIFFHSCPFLVFADLTKPTVVEDLKWSWYVCDKEGKYIPYLTSNEYEVEVFGFFLKREKHEYKTIQCSVNKGTSLFMDNNIVAYYENSTVLSFDIDSLMRQTNKEELWVSFYSPNLNIEEYKTYIVEKSTINEDFSNGLIKRKTKNHFKDFFILLLVITLAFFALVYSTFPKELLNIFNMNSVLFATVQERKMKKSKMFDRTNSLILLLIALILSLISIVSLRFSNVKLSMSNIIATENQFIDIIIIWGLILIIILSFLVVKYFFTLLLSVLFRLEIENIHFFNYMKLNTIFGSIVLIAISMIIFVGGTSSYVLGQVYPIMIVISFIIAGILFFKLLQFSNYRKTHLFLYICTTELIPIFAIAKMLQ